MIALDAATASHNPRHAVARLAEEAVARLDAAGAARARLRTLPRRHDRQKIALEHPDRIESLVLAATTAGETDREVIDFMLEQQRGATRASRGRLHEPQHSDRRPAGAAD